MANMSEVFEVAGPIQVDALPEAIAEARRQGVEATGGEVSYGDFTPRDDFAGVVSGLCQLIHCRLLGMDEESLRLGGFSDILDLINGNLGVGPASVGYLIADLAEIMLRDPLDDLPVIDR